MTLGIDGVVAKGATFGTSTGDTGMTSEVDIVAAIGDAMRKDLWLFRDAGACTLEEKEEGLMFWTWVWRDTELGLAKEL